MNAIEIHQHDSDTDIDTITALQHESYYQPPQQDECTLCQAQQNQRHPFQQRRVSMKKELWTQLSESEQKAWDQLSDKAKGMLLGCANPNTTAMVHETDQDSASQQEEVEQVVAKVAKTRPHSCSR